MDLRWWPVAIAACLGLALCVAAALRPIAAQRRTLRPLANAGRLTELPEYVRAARMRTVAAVVGLALLGVTFAAAVVAAARPTGLPTTARASAAGQPEDIMLCIAPPATAPAAAATLAYFAKQVRTFDTQRIGLTSANRRVVPLTRDYQYAAAEFDAQAGGSAAFVAPVSYADYAQSVDDLVALCLTGFPDFDKRTTQSRSLIYVGPDSLRAPGDVRPALFTPDRVTELATTAGVQVNALVTASAPSALARLAAATGGRAVPAGGDVAAQLTQLRNQPPVPTPGADALTTSPDSPDLPLAVALLAGTLLVGWPAVRRR